MKTEYQIVDTVLITEKSALLKEQNKYAFKVHKGTSKIEIAKAIEKLFEVKVKSVNVTNYKGKLKRAGKSARMGRRSDWRKAIVTLSQGTIEVLQ